MNASRQAQSNPTDRCWYSTLFHINADRQEKFKENHVWPAPELQNYFFLNIFIVNFTLHTSVAFDGLNFLDTSEWTERWLLPIVTRPNGVMSLDAKIISRALFSVRMWFVGGLVSIRSNSLKVNRVKSKYGEDLFSSRALGYLLTVLFRWLSSCVHKYLTLRHNSKTAHLTESWASSNVLLFLQNIPVNPSLILSFISFYFLQLKPVWTLLIPLSILS